MLRSQAQGAQQLKRLPRFTPLAYLLPLARPSHAQFHGVQRTACDKQSLVQPLLGLYGELFGVKCRERATCTKASQLVEDLIEEGMEGEVDTVHAMSNLLAWLDGPRKERMLFPRSFTFVTERGSTKRTLFGDLIAKMEARQLAAVTQGKATTAVAAKEGAMSLTAGAKQADTPAPLHAGTQLESCTSSQSTTDAKPAK